MTCSEFLVTDALLATDAMWCVGDETRTQVRVRAAVAVIVVDQRVQRVDVAQAVFSAERSLPPQDC